MEQRFSQEHKPSTLDELGSANLK